MKTLMALLGALSIFRLFRPKPVPTRGVLAGQTWSAVVDEIIDGDTIWVRFNDGRVRVRFAHIDAPEHGQPWSEEATTWLRAVLPIGSGVLLAPIETEEYGRVLANVYTRNWRGRPKAWMNYWLVRNGLAWAVPRCSDRDCAEAHIAAQKSRVGLWQESYPTPPWVFRRAAVGHHGAN